MSKYETRIQQFGLVSGVRQPTSDLLLLAEPAALFAPEARKGRLVIVTEVGAEAARGRDACHLVTKTIRKAFYEDNSYSVTSSLRKALVAANKALYQQNFNTSLQKRAYVGVTCVVLKEQDLYVAQAQPTQAFLLAEGKLRSFPLSTSNSSGVTSQLHAKALGHTISIEPDFYRATLKPGDMLLAASSNIGRALSQGEIMGILRRSNPADIVEALYELCQQHELSDGQAVVLGMVPALSPAAQAAPLSRSGVSERGRLALRNTGEAVERLTGELALLVKGRGAREQKQKAERRHAHKQAEERQLNTLPEEPPPVPNEDLRVAPLDLGETMEERIARERREQDERLTRLGAPPPRLDNVDIPPSSFLGEGSYAVEAPVERRIDLSDTPGMASRSGKPRPNGQSFSLEPTFGERIAQPFAQVGASLSRLGRRKRLRRPPQSAMSPVRRKAGLSYRKEGPSFPWPMLGLLITIVALAIVYGRMLMSENTRQQQAETLEDARQAVAILRTAPDEATAEQYLQRADEALDIVRVSGTISSSQELRQAFVGLEREFETVQAEVRRLTYFSDLEEIGQHPQSDAGATFSSLVVPPAPTTITNTVGFSSIYALDGAAGAMFRLPKTGGDVELFLSEGQSLRDGTLSGKVQAIAWRLDNIVAVARVEGGYVYYFRNSENWDWSNLGGSGEWRRTSDVRLRFVTYGGNLYFWGALTGQVLRYLSGSPGDLFTPWINEYGGQNVESALDLAVDGNVYLLQPDGRVIVFNANAFIKELPTPQLSPQLGPVSSFIVTGDDPEQGYIFLLDTNNERIVQLNKQTGEVIQQIRVRPNSGVRLNNLSTLAVDASGPQPILYMVNAGKILRSTLPTAPRPWQQSTTPVPSASAEATAQP